MEATVFAQYLVNGLTTGAIYVLVAVGLSLIFGVLDTPNFAHGEFYMVGAYAAFLCASRGMPVLLVLIMAALAGALAGALGEYAVFRPHRSAGHINSMVASMGLSMVMANGCLLLFTPTPRRLSGLVPEGVVSVLGVTISFNRLIVVGAAIVFLVLLYLLVYGTWIGLAMRASSQDSRAALIMGVNLNVVAVTAFAIGGGLAAVAGLLVGSLFVLEPTMGGIMGLKAFSVVILGGMGNMWGAVLGGFLLGLAEAFAAPLMGTGFKDVLAFGLMIIVLVFQPKGLVSRG